MALPSLLLVILSIQFLTIAKVQEVPTVPSTSNIVPYNHPLWSNLNQNFSWEDPTLQTNLWKNIKLPPATPKDDENQHSLQKRQMITIPTCLSCRNNDPLNGAPGTVTLADLSISKLSQAMIPGSTIGSCVFYGQRPSGAIPNSLSRLANSYTCGDPNFYSIWDLWPYVPVDEDTAQLPGGSDGAACKESNNYYCLNYAKPNCCWLNGILDPLETDQENKDIGLQYFRAMSRAFAQTCTGTVYIILDDPNKITDQYNNQDTSIWLSDELDTLIALYRQNIVTALKVLTTTGYTILNVPGNAIDKTSVLAEQNNKPKKRNELDDEIVYKMARDLKEARRRSLKQAKSRGANATNVLHKRLGGCDLAANWEDPSLDYFG